MKNNIKILITEEDIIPYGDDLRAIIRAFADKFSNVENNNIKALKWLKQEIDFILQYEVEE